MTLSVEQHAPQDTGAQKARAVEVLEQGRLIERELAAGETHTYQITLAEGEFLSLVVEQRGIDVAVKVVGPDGRQISEIDSEPRKQGEERMSQVAEVAGSYRLIVQAAQRVSPAGRYEIRVAELRAATERDRQLQEARKLGEESSRLFRAGKYDEALPLAECALEIREKELGPEHLDVAHSLNNLAIIYRRKGDAAKAEPLHLRALAIREKALGLEHPQVAQSLHNLANLYDDKGDSAKAEPLYQRALAIREKTLGPEHPLVAHTLNNLSDLYAAKGDIAQAVTFQSRAVGIGERNIVYNLSAGSERQKLAYLATLSARASQTISLHVRYAPSDPVAASLAATTILQRKGRTLDEMSGSFAALRQRFNPQDQALLNQLNEITAQLARLVLGGPKRMALAEH